MSDSLQHHGLYSPWNSPGDLPGASPGDLPNPGVKPGSPALQVDSLPAELPGKPETEFYILIPETTPVWQQG